MVGSGWDPSVYPSTSPQFERVSWFRDPGLRSLYMWAVVLMVASATTGYDGSLLNTSQQFDLWQSYFDDPKNDAVKLGLMNNAYNYGSIVSFLLVPPVADRWGRKLCIVVGCLIMILGGCVSAFCANYPMYLAGRFVLGFGNSLAQMASPLLLTEICHPQHRGPVTAVYNCLWYLGSLCECAVLALVGRELC